MKLAIKVSIFGDSFEIGQHVWGPKFFPCFSGNFLVNGMSEVAIIVSGTFSFSQKLIELGLSFFVLLTYLLAACAGAATHSRLKNALVVVVVALHEKPHEK